MIAVLDYGMGNLFSLLAALDALGAQAELVRDEAALQRAERIILPGVGAFGDAMDCLTSTGLDQALIQQAKGGKPVLGICLGMQLMYQQGQEHGLRPGLGLLAGQVLPMASLLPPGLKLPHIGWNALKLRDGAHPMLRYTKPGDWLYFVHSYCAQDNDQVLALCEYGQDIPACVAKGNVWGCQFHPEKSGVAGQGILRAFLEVQA